ncbi:NmrA-like family protein [Macrophomina phaseolina]|uniref:NmrA-like family protein n=1 Tax=Macrophomina phaseolina TaxID=35725 RepID=A0ABQ8GTW8_9PEZI|nr:NmrA-like family protein [Macrophomina phaseolina]
MLILIWGITGLVGLPCAKAALARGHSVRRLARNPLKLDKDLLESLEGFIQQDDTHDIATHERSVSGVYAIISARSGSAELVLEGQLLLLRAAERAGIKIFHGSSWNLDWSKAKFGDQEGYDPIISFWWQTRLASSIEAQWMFTGAIVEYIFERSAFVWDRQTKTFSFWGKPETKIPYTTADDLAAYTLEAIAAPDATEGEFIRVESFRASNDEVVQVYEAARGGRVKAHLNRIGSREDAEKALAKGRATIPKNRFREYIWPVYAIHDEIGDWDYEPVDVARFPQVKQTSLEEWLEVYPEI